MVEKGFEARQASLVIDWDQNLVAYPVSRVTFRQTNQVKPREDFEAAVVDAEAEAKSSTRVVPTQVKQT